MNTIILPAPEWADPELSDTTSSITAEGGSTAIWATLIAEDGDVTVRVERTDFEQGESVVVGPVEIALNVALEERIAVSSAADLRRIAAVMLNAADEIDSRSF